MGRVVLLLGLMGWAAHTAGAERPGVDNAARAQVNYMLNCQGCHGPDGAGTADGAVPAMKNMVARFLGVEGGRAFLIRVPGSANAALDDEALAEVINWMLWQVSPAQMPADFVPYDAAEVERWRAQPLADVIAARAALVAKMDAAP
jgi:mono/diheme cytochrome c family protein